MKLALTSNFLYTLLATGFIPFCFSIPIFSFQFGLRVGKTYSFAIFGEALAGAKRSSRTQKIKFKSRE